MMKYYLKDLKKVLFICLNTYFKEKDYNFSQKNPVQYNLDFEDYKITLSFDFATNSYLHKVFPIDITFNEVLSI